MTGWLDLPWADLPASVRIDVLGVLAYGKPAIRIPAGNADVRENALSVIAAAGWSHVRDDDYIVAAEQPELARHILDVDRSARRHTLELGLLLGYPECCARVAAHAGEENIDKQAARLGADCDREGIFCLDPRGYAAGSALVPYVACSPRCPRALEHAKAATQHIIAAPGGTATREPWRTWRQALDASGAPASGRRRRRTDIGQADGAR